MLWFFEKQREKFRFEVRRHSDGAAFELVITYPDGREAVETFSDLSALSRRSEHLQNALAEAGWNSPASRRRSRL